MIKDKSSQFEGQLEFIKSEVNDRLCSLLEILIRDLINRNRSLESEVQLMQEFMGKNK